jgi:hypothetical protein
MKLDAESKRTCAKPFDGSVEPLGQATKLLSIIWVSTTLRWRPPNKLQLKQKPKLSQQQERQPARPDFFHRSTIPIQSAFVVSLNFLTAFASPFAATNSL